MVAKKNQAGKRAHRPAGVKGPFKMVDKRMKKDDKSRKAAERRQRGKKARKPKKWSGFSVYLPIYYSFHLDFCLTDVIQENIHKSEIMKF